MDLQRILNTPQRRLPSEIPETPSPITSPSRASTQSWDSQNGPRPSTQATEESQSSVSSFNTVTTFVTTTPPRDRSEECTRDKRIQIQTALLFKAPYKEIREKLDVTDRQIKWARKHRLTPQKARKIRPKLHTPQKQILDQFFLESPSHRHVPFRRIPDLLPELNAKEDAIRTAASELGYCRRKAHKKGFSDDPRVWAQRLAFAEEGITWDRDRVQRQMFSDEVWAMGGAHTESWVTVKEDGSDRYWPENLQHKYSKAPAWMFHGTIVDGKKGPAVFWEKEWGTVNSEQYDRYILSNIQAFLQEHPLEGYLWMHDGAGPHRSLETKFNLFRRRIPNIRFPPYSPDLNLIEHVWNWMKNWIEEHYWKARYRPDRISFIELRAIIWEAWNAVPDDYIQSLYNSWWKRCQAIIDANGGPTKY
jgi:hypothetical protein